MRFIIMAMATKESESAPPPKPEAFVAMQEYNEKAVKAGVLLAAEGLGPTSKGARVKFNGDKRTVIDGPFTETKELVAGFMIIKVKSLEEAIEWVKRAPNAKMKELLGKGGPKLFTPWMALQDQELAEEK